MKNTNKSFVGGSLIEIVIEGRVNYPEENINPIILEYIKIQATMMKMKCGDLSDLKIVYMGGFINGALRNSAGLYFSAFKTYFEHLGYGKLNKENFKVIEEEDYKNNREKTIETIKNSDCVILGMGNDLYLGNLMRDFARNKDSLVSIAEENNIYVTGICSGTVLTAELIYGGFYDKEFGIDPGVYPKSYPGFEFNPVTMETNYKNENVSTKEKNEAFKQKYLLPDSFGKTFFCCRPNSFVYTIEKTEQNEEVIAAIGEIYLFMDGIEYVVCGKEEKVDIKNLNKCVNEFNAKKSIDLKNQILEELKKLKPINVTENGIYTDYLENCNQSMNQKASTFCTQIEGLKSELQNLSPNSKPLTEYTEEQILEYKTNFPALNESKTQNELYIKIAMISIIEKYRRLSKIDYPKHPIFFDSSLSNLISEMPATFPLLLFYFLEIYPNFFKSNAKKKKLLKSANDNLQSRKEQILNNGESRKKERDGKND